jgi:hypothetical protein
MTVVIELKPETEATLLMRAAARGLALPQYVEQVLESQVQPERLPTALTPHERAAAWRSPTALPLRPPLSDEAIDRASMYDIRG